MASIHVHNAQTHNLRGIDVEIPHGKLVVVTGVSGSGKSSLVFDTIFAEGRRRYLGSLSVYSRQFIKQLQRPEVDLLTGLPPTIVVEQRTLAAGHRSTLATLTEIADYLRVLYARAGVPHCTNCGTAVAAQTTEQIVAALTALPERTKLVLLAPLVRGRKGSHRELLQQIAKDGFVRARVDGEMIDVTEPPKLAASRNHDIEAVIDRLVVKPGFEERLAESVWLAVRRGNGACIASIQKRTEFVDRPFSTKFACPNCGESFLEVEPRTFSFNSPYGACPLCHGLGVLRNDEDDSAESDDAKVCPECDGSRLGPVGRNVTWNGLTFHAINNLSVAAISELLDQPVEAGTGSSLEAAAAAEKLVPIIRDRLGFLQQVGLDYLTLDRPVRTLSGGELQRARLTSCLGSGLIGICYILDEPTSGLHAEDTARLLDVLRQLRDAGNTVLVVEHDLDVIRAADYVIDLGPGGGSEGGQIVAAGTLDELQRHDGSQTAAALRNDGTVKPGSTGLRGEQVGIKELSSHPQRELFADETEIETQEQSRQLQLTGCTAENLRDIDVAIPLGRLVCVTGVSGSGKSSLVMKTLVPAVRAMLADGRLPAGVPCHKVTGTDAFERLQEIGQQPLGVSGRSSPATYCGIWDEIRKVFAKTKLAKLRGYKARRFSFNVKDGRCDACAGRGSQRLEMKFLPDVTVPCPVCHGARFNPATLAVRYKERSIADVLEMRIEDASDYFAAFPKIHRVLAVLREVGLGYLSLGQPAPTLSGGEAQRVKLATELAKGDRAAASLFVLDEPTSGLHVADVARLLAVLRRLTENGHTVVVIEHHLHVIAAADWIIDLGPGSGSDGGRLVAAGLPAHVAATETATGRALAGFFSG